VFNEPTQEYIGLAQNGTMHLTVFDPTTNQILGSYDLTYGVTGQGVIITCP